MCLTRRWENCWGRASSQGGEAWTEYRQPCKCHRRSYGELGKHGRCREGPGWLGAWFESHSVVWLSPCWLKFGGVDSPAEVHSEFPIT